ncbi:hypothetical protein [Caballeronia novacaledonica]|uniref:hypothetical protein n=1 Tax=Caballeronia novacaledonica TaxID=1544861 RepID=UPI001FE7734E|nr:hypothetical protein [Caballeronia novacaledonica]
MEMLEYRHGTVLEVAACISDRCQRRITPEVGDFDRHEQLSISFEAGCGSIFGDGSKVRLDLRQFCVRDALGAWLQAAPK